MTDDERPICGVIRPGTLGYQACRLDPHGDGPHRSQDGQEWDPLAGLSPRMVAALGFVLRPIPGSIHEHDRNPYGWVLMEPKPTVKALASRGLVDEWWADQPQGYRGHLTDAGLAARDEVLRRKAATKAAVRRLATG